ncbi:MAG: hypothetical protein HXY34_07625 [Candidatus Thorarchaeota archaeon]|nr:hypothetical protein [Candidatus Thorarchaeota archaeon]
MSSTHHKNTSEAALQRMENHQARLTAYNRRVGRFLLYLLPLVLVALTVISVLHITESLLLLSAFVVVLVIFAVNTLILGQLAAKTKAAFTGRLELERQKGRPLDSLQGFTSIKSNVNRTITTIRSVFILGVLVFLLYAAYVYLALTGSDQSSWVAVLGLGLSLICFGAALLVKTVKIDVTSIAGLSDFYRPSSHEVLLDNIFSDVFRGHLDPIARLKWDEFTEAIRRCLRKEFVDAVLRDESEESPVALALEKILYLHYMEYSGVLTHQQVIDELTEFLSLDTGQYHPDVGTDVGGRKYFTTDDVFKVFQLIESNSPALFDLIDRLQLELVDNAAVMAEDPVYVDAAAEEVCRKDGECNLFLILFNNAPEPRDYTVRITVAGLEPKELRVRVSAEGRGQFKIPSESVPLVSDSKVDVAHILATLLKNSVSLWLTLEPREIGTQTLQVFVEDSSGRVIEGKTMPVTIIRNIEYLLRRVASAFSIVGGSTAPLLRQFIGF